MNIEAFDNKIQNIKDELNSLSSSVLSANERIDKIKEIQEKTKQTKEELENEMNNLTDEEKEKAETHLNTLNELISFELALYTTATTTNTQTEQAPWDWNKKEGFFNKAKDWIWDQWKKLTVKEEREKESKWATAIRALWFIATWGWAITLAYKWIKSLIEKRKEKKEAKKAQEWQENKSWFRQRPFWRVLKRLWIWSVVAWWTYAVWKHFNRWDRLKQRRSNRWNKDNTDTDNPETDQEFWKDELWQLSWFETECKELINQANSRRKLASTSINHIDNAKEYNRILKKALYLQEKAVEIYMTIFNSSEASDEIKNETENLKSSIDSAVRKIYQMKDEVFQNVPKWADLWDEDELTEEYKNNESSGGYTGNKEDNPKIDNHQPKDNTAPEEKELERIENIDAENKIWDFIVSKVSGIIDKEVENEKLAPQVSDETKSEMKNIIDQYLKQHNMFSKQWNQLVFYVDLSFSSVIHDMLNKYVNQCVWPVSWKAKDKINGLFNQGKLKCEKTDDIINPFKEKTCDIAKRYNVSNISEKTFYTQISKIFSEGSIQIPQGDKILA